MKEEKKKCVYDGYKKKIKKTQEFLDARRATLHGLIRKFSVTPIEEGYSLVISGRRVCFSKHDIDVMYHEFRSVSSELHGRG